jgi:hypothetical protein
MQVWNEPGSGDVRRLLVQLGGEGLVLQLGYTYGSWNAVGYDEML